jgi:hypothetical protein
MPLACWEPTAVLSTNTFGIDLHQNYMSGSLTLCCRCSVLGDDTVGACTEIARRRISSDTVGGLLIVLLSQVEDRCKTAPGSSRYKPR